MTKDQELAAISALMDCVPYLESRIGEHSDRERLLLRRIGILLDALGYPGWIYGAQAVVLFPELVLSQDAAGLDG